jgi:hypothetical protein
MTVEQLRLRLNKRYATELHLNAADYAEACACVRAVTRKPLARDPQKHVEHFVFEGVRVVRIFEP